MAKQLASYDPSNGELLGEVQITETVQIGEMVAKAQAASKVWRKHAIAERVALLQKAYAQLEPQMDELAKLADKMGQCAKCLQDGQLQDANAAMDQLMAGVGDLQQQLDEMQMLEDAMDQLAQARERMNCPDCDGFG